MSPERFFVFFYVFALVEGRGKERKRGRMFSFAIMDENRYISIDLDFSIPFITIPVKKTIESVNGLGLSTININPAALALGGAVVLGTTVLIPLLLKNYVGHYPNKRYSRILENTEFGTDAVISFASQILTDHREFQGCALRFVCWTSQERYADRIFNLITNNDLLSTMINSTAIEDAITSGRSGRDCMAYNPCPLREHQIQNLINSFALFTNSYN